MATVRLHSVELHVQTSEMAVRILEQVMYEVAFGARLKVLAGPYTTGNLAESIERRGPYIRGTTVSGAVGTDAVYAASVHGGAKVHDIFPKRAPHTYRFGKARAPMLKFFWRKAGKTVYMNQIPGAPSRIGLSHPGQSGKHFISDPLKAAAIRHGMNYIVTDI